MSAFVLKLVACIAMLVDHCAFVFEEQLSAVSPWLYIGCRMFGRIAFPLFAMGIAEGVTHTRSSSKYIGRMVLFALLAQLPFSLMIGTRIPSVTVDMLGLAVPLYTSLSVMVTLTLGLCLCVAIHEGKHFLGAFALAAAFLVDRTVGMDYGLLGVLFIAALYMSRTNKFRRFLVMVVFAMLFYIDPIKKLVSQLAAGPGTHITVTTSILYCAATAFAAFIMLLYNHEPGRRAKLFGYFFYPLHMLAVWLLWFFYSKL